MIANGPVRDACGISQALFNQIIFGKMSYAEIIKSTSRSGVLFNMGDERVIGVDESGCILNEAGLKPNALHQYDRISGLEEFLRTSLPKS